LKNHQQKEEEAEEKGALEVVLQQGEDPMKNRPNLRGALTKNLNLTKDLMTKDK
jgi:hypothetical protein